MTNNNVTAAQEKMLPGWLILLGALTAIGPLSIDMYLPSFSTIAKYFAVGSNPLSALMHRQLPCRNRAARPEHKRLLAAAAKP